MGEPAIVGSTGGEDASFCPSLYLLWFSDAVLRFCGRSRVASRKRLQDQMDQFASHLFCQHGILRGSVPRAFEPQTASHFHSRYR